MSEYEALDKAAREFIELYDRQGYQDTTVLPALTRLRRALEATRKKMD